ncbi:MULTISPECIES: uracil-DNA glycosylase family protein [unclassified Rhizobium]|uniref:uracil-DNA glycosylase family protein n=1 Tax=unclassified Rhizobium TaxID=2613769 RepID=UPI00161FDA68|nr:MULTISPECIES: uracil-DNA glycosylase family protein [unclassified Rhizobium]MBB3382083.1 uracil-DNA glycosylase [Rhizobium sp. BK098]MBB3566472.1 uracil-DNA glycosylase [Rhizobium sp. BK491]MBB3613785.1 uracil-DNA glycosylase [Rhizobium sp. BK609]MBB3679443.1 uracil-DNA glycosylase [Rhizobium sp. BK612]
MKHEGELQILRSAIAACRLCRDAPAKGEADRLPHEPRPVATLSSTARILIAGQAPGLRVHESGLPFNDASGDRLRQWLAVDRESFYNTDHFAIMGMGFCFPGYDKAGSDLPPRKECAPLWRQRAMDAMPQIELILTIGQYAQAWHLGAERMGSMTETVAEWRRYLLTNRSPSVLPLPHPSWRNSGWLKRNPWFEAELLPVLQQRVKSLLP